MQDPPKERLRAELTCLAEIIKRTLDTVDDSRAHMVQELSVRVVTRCTAAMHRMGQMKPAGDDERALEMAKSALGRWACALEATESPEAREMEDLIEALREKKQQKPKASKPAESESAASDSSKPPLPTAKNEDGGSKPPLSTVKSEDNGSKPPLPKTKNEDSGSKPPATPEKSPSAGKSRVRSHDGVCWNCDEYGHRFSSCPQRLTMEKFCRWCGRKGYTLATCPDCSPVYWEEGGPNAKYRSSSRR